MKHIAIIHYGRDELALGLGETEQEAAANAVEAYGGPEAYLRMGLRGMPAIYVYDLVDGMRLNYGDNDAPYRIYKGPIGAADAAGPRP